MNGEHNSFHGGLQAISGHAGHQWRVKDCHNLSAPYHSEKHNDPRRLAPGHSENEKSAQSSNECDHPRRSAPGPGEVLASSRKRHGRPAGIERVASVWSHFSMGMPHRLTAGRDQDSAHRRGSTPPRMPHRLTAGRDRMSSSFGRAFPLQEAPRLAHGEPHIASYFSDLLLPSRSPAT